MRTHLPQDIIPCPAAVNTICRDETCTKLHCEVCLRHTCPVCGKHYRVAIFAGDPKGCSTECIKVTNNDIEPFLPDHIKKDRERDAVDPGWRGRGGTVHEQFADGKSIQALVTLLRLVVHEGPLITRTDIKNWSARERDEVARWASMVHLAASDNDVTVPPKPKVLTEREVASAD